MPRPLHFGYGECRKPAPPGQMLCKIAVGSVPRSGAGRAGLGLSRDGMIFGLWA
jgi:hypothetical protein